MQSASWYAYLVGEVPTVLCLWVASASRHDVVETLVGDVELRERLRNAHLRAMPDIERLAHKLDRCARSQFKRSPLCRTRCATQCRDAGMLRVRSYKALEE